MVIEFSSLIFFSLVFFYLVIVCMFVHFKKEINYKNKFLNLCIFISTLLIVSQTLFPINMEYTFEGFKIYNIIPFKVLYETYKNYSFDYFLYQLFGNVLMFVPLGYFVYLKTNRNKSKTVLIAFLTTLFIEFVQGFIPYRFCEIDDIWLNTFGGYIGITMCTIIDKFYKVFNSNDVK